jgi:glutaredoxin
MHDSKKITRVTLYTTPGCPDCAAVKRYLEQKRVPYQEKDVSRNEAWIDEMKQIAGVRIAPVTVIGDQAFYGTFDQQRLRIDAALAQEGDASRR